MSNIIELIKILRERTGAGMMDCKKALEQNDCDVEKACDWLREKGIAKAATKASRIAAEGLTHVELSQSGDKAVIVEINCETDFVAKSDDFKKLIQDVTAILMQNEPKDIESAKLAKNEAGLSITDIFTNVTVKIGEKLDLRRFEVVKASGTQELGAYIHMGGKISVLVVTDKKSEHAKGLAMHIAASNPQFISKTDIPADAIEHEKKIQIELAKSDEKLAGKPADVISKILDGKVNKIFSETTLSEQVYLLDGENTVEKFLKQNNLAVVKFVRYQVGEGIEKRKDNFAEEVMNQIK